MGRTHHYGKALGDFRNGDPLVMEIAAVDRRGSVTSTGSVAKMTSLARIELTNEAPQWFEWNVYMEAGYEPEVRFRNGPLSAKRMVRVLTTQAADKPEFKPFVEMKGSTEKGHGVLKAYKGPRLRVWEIQVEGPHVNTWPSAGHRVLYGNLTPDELNATTITQRLASFAERAFRRPPVDGELRPIQDLVASKLIRYDEIDRSDVQYLVTQSRTLFRDIEAAAKRLPAPFARDPVVLENLENLRSDMTMWGVLPNDEP